MATATARGWSLRPATVRVPCAGIQLNLRPEVAPLFAELIRRVEAIKGPGWMVSAGGYNPRPVRGYELKYASTNSETYLSNHAWGLAADFRAGTNGMGNTLKTDMPSNIRQIAAACGLEWGGDYAGRKDPMHFEFVGTPAQAAAAVARLNNQEDDLTPEDRAMLTEVRDRLRNLDGIVTRSGLGTPLTSLVDGKTKAYQDQFTLWGNAKLTGLVKDVAAILKKLGA